MCCEDDCRNQVRERYPNPHKGPCALLIPKGSHAEQLSCRSIIGINKPVTKDQERRKNVARQGGKKKI